MLVTAAVYIITSLHRVLGSVSDLVVMFLSHVPLLFIIMFLHCVIIIVVSVSVSE